jgi:hypothetical protein
MVWWATEARMYVSSSCVWPIGKSLIRWSAEPGEPNTPAGPHEPMSEHVTRLRGQLEPGEGKDAEDVMVGSVGHILKSTFASLYSAETTPGEASAPASTERESCSLDYCVERSWRSSQGALLAISCLCWVINGLVPCSGQQRRSPPSGGA